MEDSISIEEQSNLELEVPKEKPKRTRREKKPLKLTRIPKWENEPIKKPRGLNGWKKKPLRQRKCPYCGKLVLINGRRARKFRFCSNECKWEVTRQRTPIYTAPR